MRNPFRYFNSSPEVIRLTVMIYIRCRWREAVALKRYRFHPMMLIGDDSQCYPSYRDIAV
jgi:hypothetical protein